MCIIYNSTVVSTVYGTLCNIPRNSALKVKQREKADRRGAGADGDASLHRLIANAIPAPPRGPRRAGRKAVQAYRFEY